MPSEAWASCRPTEVTETEGRVQGQEQGSRRMEQSSDPLLITYLLLLYFHIWKMGIIITSTFQSPGESFLGK